MGLAGVPDDFPAGLATRSDIIIVLAHGFSSCLIKSRHCTNVSAINLEERSGVEPSDFAPMAMIDFAPPSCRAAALPCPHQRRQHAAAHGLALRDRSEAKVSLSVASDIGRLAPHDRIARVLKSSNSGA